MTLPIDDATRVRVIRALLGMNSRQFAKHVGISPGTLTAWERSRSTPQADKRKVLATICQQNGLCFLPSGMPVPGPDCLALKTQGE